LVLIFSLVCCDSETSSDGCSSAGSTERCEIDAAATVCGDRITLECFDGATPDATQQCQLALEQDGQSLYCCTNAAEEVNVATDPSAGGGGSGGAGT
jgi:hypothetical protein